MAIIIKSDSEIKKMRESSNIVAKTHELLERHLKVGITSYELDKIAEDFILTCDAIPSFKGYNGFPASICISINNEVIHGIPSERKILDGDVVSIDIGAYKNGFHGDAARTHGVGEIAPVHKKLIDITRQSFFEGIKFAKNGNHLYEISAAIEAYIISNGFSVVREYIGHGIGKNLHESPEVPNYKPAVGRGIALYKGLTIAIEPMVNVGTSEIDVLEDCWTVVTSDGEFSAHYENTIAITDGEPEILTLIG